MPEYTRRWMAGAAALVVALALTACTSTLPTTPKGERSPGTLGSPMASAHDQESAAPQSATPTNAPTPVPTVTPAPTMTAVPPDETSVAPRVEKNDQDGNLLAVIAKSTGNADVVTFRFSKGSIPGHSVKYVDAVRRDNDDVIMLDGSAVLTVTFTNSIPGKTGVIPANVVTNASYDLPMVRQIVLVKNLGGTLRFAIGVSTQAPFTVTADGNDLIVSLPRVS